MRVLLLAPYPLRMIPSQRYRFEQYLSLFEANGIEVEVRSLLDAETTKVLYRSGYVKEKVFSVLRGALGRVRDLIDASSFDVVFVHREAFPLGYPLVERALAALGRPYVFDFDDAIYMTNTSEANRFIAPLKFAQKTEVIVKHAALITAGNPHLAAWARALNPNVMIIPTTIDTDIYQPKQVKREGRLCVGWSGSTTTIAHLAPYAGLLRELQKTFGVRLRIIGDPSFTIEGAEVESIPWREATEFEDVKEIDIGIMPLPDEDWAKGKCGLKALQYMAAGIATVMSPVGVNVEIAEGGAAMLASTFLDWEMTLAALITDTEARERLGVNGRKRAEERYSVKANLPLYIEALQRAARSVS
jgi:glycosyltransferase involved in cell wall biosynthesis